MHFPQKSLIKVLTATAVYVMGQKDTNVRMASRKLNPSHIGVTRALRAADKPKANLKVTDAGQAPGDGAKSKLDPANPASSITERDEAAMAMVRMPDKGHDRGLADEGFLNFHGEGEHFALTSLDSNKAQTLKDEQRKPLALKSLRGGIKEEQDSSSSRQLQSTSEWPQLGNDINGEAAGDQSGESVAMSADGSIIAVGGAGGSNAGHVRVYTFDDETSNFVLRGAAIGGGSAVALSSDGKVLAVSSPYTNKVRVYKWDRAKSLYTQRGNTINGHSSNSIALSADGNILAASSGLVRAYEWDGSEYTQRGSSHEGDLFCASLDMSSDGSVLALWGRYVGVNGGGPVHVKIYEYNDGKSDYDLRDDIDVFAVFDFVGASVSLSADGSILAATSPNYDGDAVAQVYKYNDGRGCYMPRGAAIVGEGENYGRSVSLSADGDIMAIGSTGTSHGHIRVFQFDGFGYMQIGSDIYGQAAGDKFGGAVVLSVDGLVVAGGAIQNDGTGTDAGHVRVFEWWTSLLTQAADNLQDLVHAGSVTGENAGKAQAASDSLTQSIAEGKVSSKIQKIELAIETLECFETGTDRTFVEACELITKALESVVEFSS